MPHLNLEYSSNCHGFDAQATLLAINTALIATGEFKDVDVKSRAQAFDAFQIGTQGGRGFVHVRLSVMPGRSPETKKMLTERIVQVLVEQTIHVGSPADLQRTAEINEFDRAAYSKDHRAA
ncbi:5-carboxymethyl-2-hydroxymuconate Delta-isomerase [Curvibacter sp. CHRR-16]|uniref:5-carboxymethyl-2-hydroxymuconate Delta-isomerase n=1 Tax=Curvibacter sp. CHRR-16 TaxID=2835872 RepID=UPI001BDAD87E|nr:5-carboxymethyl-2-hydroxymuconate Delta-isomerase [Curvibacter sp. CHRR-16]MBT0568801.1 5-carboxymethyl-2-hydroxymuconate Delta-isomerase [Curvibacter sp. CHRR-16]